MIVSARERDAMLAALADLESIARGLASTSPTKDGIFRNVGALRIVLNKAVVSRNGRVDGAAC